MATTGRGRVGVAPGWVSALMANHLETATFNARSCDRSARSSSRRGAEAPSRSCSRRHRRASESKPSASVMVPPEQADERLELDAELLRGEHLPLVELAVRPRGV